MELADYETGVPSVLVVDGESDGGSVVRELGSEVSVEVVSSMDAATAQLSDARALLRQRDVDCLVVADEPEDASIAELVRAARGINDGLPVVVAPETGSAEQAREVTTAGATYYVPLDLAEDGELEELVAEAVDRFDDRHQVLRERNMFHELLSNTPLSVYFKDEEGRHVCVSSEATAYRDESVIGKTDYDLYKDDIGEEEARQAYEDDLHVIENAEPIVDKEERHVSHEGDVMWFRTTKVPWRNDDGEVIGLIGITRTVTEVKERELELEQEKQRLEQFASFVSHDLRNPVNVAKGYLEHARDTEDPEVLDEVAHSLTRMDQMIDDLLHMVRPDENQDMEEWTDLGEVVERTWEAVDTHDATLRVEVPEGTRVMATRGSLRQVLENLFKNAIDHGGLDVAVEVGLTGTGFYVSDDGPGIPEDDRDDVFNYGYTTGGTGVGLAIVREIADTLLWRTNVTESDAGGARFEFQRCIVEPPEVQEVAHEEGFELAEESNVDDATPAGDAHKDGAGAWTVRGGGGNVWAEVEEYYAVHGGFEGDLRFEGRISSLESIHEYSKACLFATDAVDTGGPFAAAGMTASHGAESCWRTDDPQVISSVQFSHTSALPIWIRMDRLGDTVTVYTSRNGEDWDVLDQLDVRLPEAVQLGILVCSHNEQRLCEAKFDNVRAVPLEVVEDWPARPQESAPVEVEADE